MSADEPFTARPVPSTEPPDGREAGAQPEAGVPGAVAPRDVEIPGDEAPGAHRPGRAPDASDDPDGATATSSADTNAGDGGARRTPDDATVELPVSEPGLSGATARERRVSEPAPTAERTIESPNDPAHDSTDDSPHDLSGERASADLEVPRAGDDASGPTRRARRTRHWRVPRPTHWQARPDDSHVRACDIHIWLTTRRAADGSARSNPRPNPPTSRPND